jgi:SH3-like domain-containing protein
MRKIIITAIAIFTTLTVYAANLKEYTEKAIENNTDLLELKLNLESTKKQIETLKEDEYKNLTKAEKLKLNIKTNDSDLHMLNTLLLKQEFIVSNIETIKNSLSYQITETYINVLKEKKYLKISETALKKRRTAFNRLKNRHDKNSARLSDLTLMENAYNEALYNVSIQKMNFREAVNKLGYYVKEADIYTPYDTPFIIAAKNEDLESVMKKTLTYHPAISAAKTNVELSKIKIPASGITRSNEARPAPRDANGDYSFFSKDKDFTSMDKIAKYLGDIEKQNKNLKNTQKQTELKMKILKDVMNQIEHKLKLSWKMRTAIEEKSEKIIQAYEIYKENLKKIYSANSVGKISAAEVINAENNYIKAIKDITEAEYQKILAEYQILESAGICYEQIMKADFENEQNVFSSIWEDIDKDFSSNEKFTSYELFPIELPETDIKIEPITKKEVTEEKQEIVNPRCYYVTSKTLNIRELPDHNSERKGIYKFGEKLCEYGRSDKWINTGAGWVATSYLSEAKPSEPKKNYMYVDIKKLNIRKYPSTRSRLQGSYNRGERVEITRTKGNWSRTQQGWVYNKYLSDKQPEIKKECFVVAAKKLNIRKSPSARAAKLGSYKQYETVCRTSKNGTWSKTDKGWISSNFLEKLKCYNVTAKTLNIRVSADSRARKVGEYKKGDKVCVLKTHRSWVYTGIGWVHSKYLK